MQRTDVMYTTGPHLRVYRAFRWAALIVCLSTAIAVTSTTAGAEAQRARIPATSPRPDVPQSGTSDALRVSVAAIADGATRYYGRRVVVEAKIDDVLARQVFLLEQDRPFAWPNMPVIAPPLARVPREDECVTVVGVVATFLDGIRRDHDWRWWTNVGTDMAVTFGDGPVIMAESIKTMSGEELVARSAAQPRPTSGMSREESSR